MPFGPEIAYPVDFISFMFTKCQNRKPFNYNKLSDFRESLHPMQVMVSTDEAGMVWIATVQGHRVTAGFFKAPDETPDELEHMGYPQLVHLYPAEEILVGQGIAPD